MNKLHIHILSIFSFICLSCQQQTPQNQIEQAAVDFCEAFITSIIQLPKSGALLLPYPILAF